MENVNITPSLSPHCLLIESRGRDSVHPCSSVWFHFRYFPVGCYDSEQSTQQCGCYDCG